MGKITENLSGISPPWPNFQVGLHRSSECSLLFPHKLWSMRAKSPLYKSPFYNIGTCEEHEDFREMLLLVLILRESLLPRRILLSCIVFHWLVKNSDRKKILEKESFPCDKLCFYKYLP